MKQYREYRLPLLMAGQSFCKKFIHFVTPHCKRCKELHCCTLCIKQHGEFQLFAIRDRGESIKNYKYFLEFAAEFENTSYTDQGAWEEPIREKIRDKKLVGLSL
jgi:hypothetical protein